MGLTLVRIFLGGGMVGNKVSLNLILVQYAPPQGRIQGDAMLCELCLFGEKAIQLTLSSCWGTWKPGSSKSRVWSPNMTIDTSLESSCALLLESSKKLANLQKLQYFFAKSSYIVKMFEKKNCPKMMNYTFLKSPCHGELNMQKHLKNFQKLNLNLIIT